jgi:hypothetical protein
MLGIILGVGTSSLLSLIIWNAGAARYSRHECVLIERCLTSGAITNDPAFVTTRPGRLVFDLRQIRNRPEMVVSVINEIVSDIDFETRWSNVGARAYARISATSGIAGGCIEMALRLRISVFQATVYALIAVIAGLLGAGSCAAIGHWASRENLRRRRLWDEFVQWILKSEFPQTAWTVLDVGSSLTCAIQNGQEP